MAGNEFDIKFGYNKRSAAKRDLRIVLQDIEGVPLVDTSNAPLVAEIEGFVTSELTSDKAVSIVLPTIPRVVSRFFTFVFGEAFVVEQRIVEDGVIVQDAFIRLINPEKTWQFLRVGFFIDAPTGSEIINPQTGERDGFKFEKFTIKNIVEEGFDGNGNFFVRIDLNENPTFVTVDPIRDENGNIINGNEIRSVNYIRRVLTKERIATLKIEEQFAATSEVSRSLLGIDRAETQLSLFSNVSTYGVNTDDFVFYPDNPTNGPGIWTNRQTESGINHYPARIEEVRNEGALALTAYPVPYNFPYTPLSQRLVQGVDIGGLYNETNWQKWQNFLKLGKTLYEYFVRLRDANISSPTDFNRYEQFLTRFLPALTIWDDNTFYSSINFGNNNDRYYRQISIWTETFELIKNGKLRDPVTFTIIDFNFLEAFIPVLRGAGSNTVIGSGAVIDQADVVDNGPTGIQTVFNPFLERWVNSEWSEAAIVPGTTTSPDDFRPGYGATGGHYVLLQSRQAFRYQPGRISGYTFGTRATLEKNQGDNTGEWGIFNDFEEYVFQREGARFFLVRRSNIIYPTPFLQELGLADELGNVDTEFVRTYDKTIAGKQYLMQEVKIPREKFNGDTLNGNGPSGYLLTTDEITMYKIEFGWYGAIGLRFYAYIPIENGKARWVVIHTFVIENKLNVPSMADPFFKFKYQLRIGSGQGPDLTQPQYLYKYGTSMYIDGGDEGTLQVYSQTSEPRTLPSAGDYTSILGIYPKTTIVSGGTDAQGNTVEIPNKKIIVPKQMSINSDGFAEISVVKCRGCKGSQFLYMPNVDAITTGDLRRIKKLPLAPTNEIELAPINLLIDTKPSDTELTTTDSTLIEFLRPGDYLLEDIGQNITQTRIKSITESGGTYTITLNDGQPSYTAPSTVTFQPSWIIGDEDRRKYGFDKDDFEAKIIADTSPAIYTTYLGNLTAGPVGQIINLRTRDLGNRFSIINDRFLDPQYNATADAQQEVLTPAEFFGDPATETFDIRISKMDKIAGSPIPVGGPFSEFKFLNYIPTDNNGQIAEFEVGFTPNEPVFDVSGNLTGWLDPEKNLLTEDRDGVIVNRTNLTRAECVTLGFHPYFINSNLLGLETGESWYARILPLTSDFRISNPPGSNSGRCSEILLEQNPRINVPVTQESSSNLAIVSLEKWSGFANQAERDDYLALSSFFLKSTATIVGNVGNPEGGQVAVIRNETPIINFFIGGNLVTCRFLGQQKTYLDDTDPANPISFNVIPITLDIENSFVDQAQTDSVITNPGDTFIIAYSSVTIKGWYSQGNQFDAPNSYSSGPNATGVFDFNAFPLYPIVYMRDEGGIRSAEIQDVDFQRNVTSFNPTWKVSQKTARDGTLFSTANYGVGSNLRTGQLNVNGVGSIQQTPSTIDGLNPSAFQEVDRLSSSRIDRQGESLLRPGDTLTTLYINNETKTFDLTDVFGSDRTVITPDITNTEAVYFVARSLSGTPVDIQINLTYVEQL
jgi:hypothetical protein